MHQRLTAVLSEFDTHLQRISRDAQNEQPFLSQEAYKGGQQNDLDGQATGSHDLQQQCLVCV